MRRGAREEENDCGGSRGPVARSSPSSAALEERGDCRLFSSSDHSTMEPSRVQLFYRFGVALVLGLFMGLQREYAYRKRVEEGELMAGARTFPIIALLGAASALGGTRAGERVVVFYYRYCSRASANRWALLAGAGDGAHGHFRRIGVEHCRHVERSRAQSRHRRVGSAVCPGRVAGLSHHVRPGHRGVGGGASAASRRRMSAGGGRVHCQPGLLRVPLRRPAVGGAGGAPNRPQSVPPGTRPY